MSIVIDKYIDLVSRYALCGEDGYYIDTFLIKMMIVRELNLSMPWVEIKKLLIMLMLYLKKMI